MAGFVRPFGVRAAPIAPVDSEELYKQTHGAFSQGLRAGVTGAGGALRAAVGGVAEAVGADEFAAEQYAASQAAQELAARQAPVVSSYKDVRGVRSAGQYVAGLAGQSLPYMGAGLVAGGVTALTGGGALPAFGVMTAASLPFHAGQAIQNQQDDPEALKQSAGVRLANATGVGLVNSALDNVLPAMIGGRVVARGVKQAGILPRIGTGLATGAGVEGLTEGTQEFVQQQGHGLLNPQRDTSQDTSHLIESAVGGAALGGVMGGIGGVVPQRDQQPAPVPAPVPAAPAEPIVQPVVKPRNMFKPEASADTLAARNLRDGMDGLEEINKEIYATAAPDAQRVMVEQAQARSAETAARLATEMLADPNLSAEAKEYLGQMEGDYSSPEARILIGELKWEHDRLQAKKGAKLAAMDKVDALGAELGAGVKSAQPGNVSRIIDGLLMPYLADEHGNDMFTDHEIQRIGNGVRMLAEEMSKPQSDREFDSGLVEFMSEIFDKGTLRKLMDQVREVMKGDDLQSEAFARSLQKIQQHEMTRTEQEKLITKYMDQEQAYQPLDDQDKTDWLGELRRGIVAHTNESAYAHLKTDTDRQVARQDFVNGMQELFGKNTDKVIAAFAKDGLKKSVKGSSMVDGAPQVDPEDRGIVESDEVVEDEGVAFEDDGDLNDEDTYAMAEEGEEQFEAEYLGKGFDRKGLMKHPSSGDAASLAASASIKTQNKDRNVEWVPFSELPSEVVADYLSKFESTMDGFIEGGATRAQAYKLAEDKLGSSKELGMYRAEGMKHEGRLSREEFKRLTSPVPKKGSDPLPNLIDTGGKGEMLDAIKMLKLFGTKEKTPPVKGAESGTARLFQVFSNALAQTMLHLDRNFTVPDSTVLQDFGGEKVTWGDLQKKYGDKAGLAAKARVKSVEDAPHLKGKTTEEILDLEAINEHVKESETQKLNAREVAISDRIVQLDAELENHMEKFMGQRHRSLEEYYTERREASIPLEAERKSLHAESRAIAKELEERGLGDSKYRVLKGSGVEDIDPHGNVVEVKAVLGGDMKPYGMKNKAGDEPGKAIAAEGERPRTGANTKLARKVGHDGAPVNHTELKPTEYEKGLRELNKKIERMAASPVTEMKTLAAQARALNAIANQMTESDQDRFVALVGQGKTKNDVAGVIRNLTAKYAEVLVKPEEKAAPKSAPKEVVDRPTVAGTEEFGLLEEKLTPKQQNARLVNSAEERPQPAKKPNAIKAAAEAWVERAKQGKPVQQVAAEVSGPALKKEQESQAKREKNARYAKEEDAKYGAKSEQTVGTKPMTAADEQAVRDVLDKMLSAVNVEYSTIMGHAGDYARVELEGRRGMPGYKYDHIRLSVHALDPMGTAYHEALHGFIQHMREMDLHGVNRALYNLADSPVVRAKLRKLLAGQDAALKQIEESAEERAAYIFQFYNTRDAAGKRLLEVDGGARSVLGKISDFIHKILGMWTTNERAAHIMEYFSSGEYAKTGQNDRSAVSKALLNAGTNKTVEAAKAVLKPIGRVSKNLLVGGSQVIKDMKNPALDKINALIHSTTAGQDEDVGFITASHSERAIRLNELVTKLAAIDGLNEEHMAEAIEQLQSGNRAKSKEAQIIAHKEGPVRELLDALYHYQRAAGVDLADLGVGKDYFPRVIDVDALSLNAEPFKDMLRKYVISGQLVDADQVVRNILANDGAAFSIQTTRPGNQFAKERTLDFISKEDIAPFLEKNLMRTMNSYVTQATRRAEWARRFGDRGEILNQLRQEAVAKHGATKEQMRYVEDFLSGVSGTLGDAINPKLRRLFGNLVVYQNVRLLPMAVFSMMVDPIGTIVRGGTVKDAFHMYKAGFMEVKRGFQKLPKRDDRYDLAEMLGVIDDTALVHMVGSSYTQGMVGGTARKINDGLFRYNLVEQFTTSMRVAAVPAALGFIARHADGVSSEHSKRWLAELGLKPGDVIIKDKEVLLSAPQFEDAGLSPEDAAARALQMRAAVNKWVNSAVLRPNATQKPVWMSDPHWALIAHLKQFMYSFNETIIKRVTTEVKHGNYSPALALAAYVPVMMAADFAKGMLLNGGDEPKHKKGWDFADYFYDGVQRAGLFGVAQMGVDVAKDVNRGGTGIGALAGPMIEQAIQGVETIGGKGTYSKFALNAAPLNPLVKAAAGMGGSGGGLMQASHDSGGGFGRVDETPTSTGSYSLGTSGGGLPVKITPAQSVMPKAAAVEWGTPEVVVKAKPSALPTSRAVLMYAQKITDGDSGLFTDKNGKVTECRMEYYDAPEVAHSEHGSPNAQKGGDEAHATLKSLIEGKQVSVTVLPSKTYGRNVCQVELEGTNINLEMVKRGMGMVNTRYVKNPEVVEAARKAKADGVGLMGDNPENPAEFRKHGNDAFGRLFR